MTPVRALRDAIAAVLAPLDIEIYDVLPDAAAVPCAAVGVPNIGPSGIAGSLFTFATPVTLVAERADFGDAQIRLDDLVWETFDALRGLRIEGTASAWVLYGAGRPVDVAGQTHPGYEFTIETTMPC